MIYPKWNIASSSLSTHTLNDDSQHVFSIRSIVDRKCISWKPLLSFKRW